jgi:hypothetical protein
MKVPQPNWKPFGLSVKKEAIVVVFGLARRKKTC